MNDLERDLREVFHDDARRVPTPATAPQGLRRSARRRQAAFGGAIALAGVAVVVGIVVGATSLLSQQTGPEPAAVPKTTETMSGITITYPETWNLIDPDTAGLNGSPTMGESPLPRIVLALAPTQAPETFGCPGLAKPGEAAPLLMTVQEEPRALSGPASMPWPVELQPMNVGTTESGCYPDWEFMRAGWTASGRSFEARIGFSPEASGDEREALTAAFASMTFEPAGSGTPSVELAHGTAGGVDWQLIAARQDDGLSLTLEAESSGTGSGGYDPTSDRLRPTSFVIGDDERAVRIVFGAAPATAVGLRYEISGEGPDPGPQPAILDIPDEIDPRLNAFVFTMGEGQIATVEAYDESGTVIASGETESADLPVETASGAEVEDGRHFGFIRSVNVSGRAMEFDLAYFLSGEEANQAYHEAGGTGPVPNDHFVVNDNPKLRTLTLSPDLRLRLLDWNHCCETFFDGDLSLFAQAIEQQADVTDGDLIYRGQSSWWVTVKDGVVTQIEEQYSP